MNVRMALIAGCIVAFGVVGCGKKSDEPAKTDSTTITTPPADTAKPKTDTLYLNKDTAKTSSTDTTKSSTTTTVAGGEKTTTKTTTTTTTTPATDTKPTTTTVVGDGKPVSATPHKGGTTTTTTSDTVAHPVNAQKRR